MSVSFTVNSKELLGALTAIYSVVPNKPPRDILKCFKIEALQGSDDSLVIHATDLETFVSITLTNTVIVQVAGIFTVQANILLEYIKSIEDGDITLLIVEETLKIVESQNEFQVGLQDFNEYPDFPALSADLNFTQFSLPELVNSLDQVIFAAADKGSPRWGTLNAICFETDGKTLTLIGTDQHRASIVKLDVADQLVATKYLVPAKILALLSKILTVDEIFISFDSKNNLIIKTSNTLLLIRLMHGNYPPVKDFVPKHTKSVDFNVAELLKQVKKAALATDNHSNLRLELTTDKLKLVTKAPREQRKSIKIEFPLSYAGDNFQFALNCQYLIDLLKAASNEEPLKMYFNQNNQPILFNQNGFKHLIVPQVI